MRRMGDTVVVGKNRKRAFWTLLMSALALPFSAWFLYLGLRSERGVGWPLAFFGLIGLVAFAAYIVVVLRTMRTSWRLELDPAGLTLYAPTYDLRVPWERVSGIAVDEVNHRLGCALLFDDVEAVVKGASFHAGPAQPGAVTSAPTMQKRLDQNLERVGYHLGIPGRVLELGPEALAQLLARGRTGDLWGREG